MVYLGEDSLYGRINSDRKLQPVCIDLALSAGHTIVPDVKLRKGLLDIVGGEF